MAAAAAPPLKLSPYFFVKSPQFWRIWIVGDGARRDIFTLACSLLAGPSVSEKVGSDNPALVELKPFRTCLGRPLKKPKGQFEFNYNIQIFWNKNNWRFVSEKFEKAYN
jgi:hypothetical protein